MNQLTQCTWEPVTFVEPRELERLNILDWGKIHSLVQNVLEGADDFVRSRVPDVHIVSGSTRSRSSFALFSYRTYQSTPNVDPVVLGLTFQPIPEGIRVTGDICGESCGDSLFQTAPTEIADDDALVSSAATDVSRCLLENLRFVACALNDPHRQPLD